ncbi:MAG: type II secretion system protein GspG [Planctomycetota bacterium]
MTDRRNIRSRRGFSLIELMLVIAIIGMLGAVAAFSIAGVGDRARINTTETSMRTIKSAIETYQLNEGSYPPDLQTLVAERILDDKQLQDAWKTGFWYRNSGTGGKPFLLVSYGPDKEGGTEDDLDIWLIDADNSAQ